MVSFDKPQKKQLGQKRGYRMAYTRIRTADGINDCKADESSPKDGYKVLNAFKILEDCHVPAIGKMSGC